MKRYFFPLIIIVGTLPVSAQLVLPQDMQAVKVEVASSTGIDGGLYVLPTFEGVEIGYRSTTPVTWQRFSNLGAAYAEEISEVRHDGDMWYVTAGRDDIGLIVRSRGVSKYYWFVNYANHELQMQSVGFSEQQECDRTNLHVEGHGERMVFYTINGRQEEISRQLQVSYTSLAYDEESESYRQVEQQSEIPYLQEIISVEAPLCDTSFKIEGDRFLKVWKRAQTVESAYWNTISVAAETTAEQAERDVPNEQKDSGAGALGGSAPCDIRFSAAVTDAAVFREWQIASDPEFGILDMSYNDLEFEHTFREQGTKYVRFIANNAEGTCEFIGETYEIFIGESALRCPNAFTPFTSPGTNDEWRVSYKSLVSFECHIFNKLGIELFSTTDPATGWDGKYGGKYVPAGTYYYVIKAEGSDGKQYKLSGDINIIGQHGGSTSTATEGEAE